MAFCLICKQVKAEITEIVTFLRNPRKFLSMGARSPAGILLVGPPGAALMSSVPFAMACERTHAIVRSASPGGPCVLV